MIKPDLNQKLFFFSTNINVLIISLMKKILDGLIPKSLDLKFKNPFTKIL